MGKRYLGKIELSPIGMWCMAFSHGYGQIPLKEYAIEAIKEAYAHGCTFFGTAEGYGSTLYYEHHNEEILGEALKDVRIVKQINLFLIYLKVMQVRKRIKMHKFL